jgi:NAD(P)-dependent dehydrogenase (short-subunit alcohol dehydrogenase family)
MRALTYHGAHSVKVDTVPDPIIEENDDIILRVTATAICGSDLHLYRGKIPTVEQGLQTDLLGYLRGAYVAMPYFKAQKRGILINTLSLGIWVAQPYALAYSASRYGLRGLSEALRGELYDYPEIHVCDIYPAVMDTPGFRDGGNFTGHALKPPPPVYDPHLVAEAMVACALRPRPTTTVGAAATMAQVAHFLLPGFPYVSGWLTRLGLQNRPQAASSSGNLFTPSGAPRQVERGGGQRRIDLRSP